MPTIRGTEFQSDGVGLALSGLRRKGDQQFGQLLPLVLLEEVTRLFAGGMLTVAGSGHPLLEPAVPASRDGVGVREGGQERLLPRLENLPGGPVGGRGGIVGRGRKQRGEDQGAGLIGGGGKRCFIGGEGL